MWIATASEGLNTGQIFHYFLEFRMWSFLPCWLLPTPAPCSPLPFITSQQSNILRSYGNLGQVSTYSKTIDTPYSSVRKSDVRVCNNALAYPAAPVLLPVPVQQWSLPHWLPSLDTAFSGSPTLPAPLSLPWPSPMVKSYLHVLRQFYIPLLLNYKSSNM
jgi:hypothetical protein